MQHPFRISPVIRPMAPADLERIVEIDVEVLGKSRPEYWKTKIETVRNNPQFAALVAEVGGRVVGFVIGGASQGEYGIPANVGWIDTIGVDPEYQHKGIAKTLYSKMVENLKQAGVDAMYTFVGRLDWKLLKFFNSVGFQKGDMVHLEMQI